MTKTAKLVDYMWVFERYEKGDYDTLKTVTFAPVKTCMK